MTKRLRFRIAKKKLQELAKTGKLITSPATAMAVIGLANNSDMMTISIKHINKSATLLTYGRGQ